MKNLLWIIFFGLSLSIFFSSCNDTRTYAREVEAERALINDFIRRQGIVTTDRMPTDSEFLNNPKLYFRSTSGLLYRLERASTRPDSDTIVPGDRLLINARFIEYTLTARADTADFRSPQSFPFGSSFIFGGGNTTSAAFLEAVRYMKKSETHAKLIVPHRIGFNSTIVTPYGYDLEIIFRKDGASQ
jgi:hypothetical protein